MSSTVFDDIANNPAAKKEVFVATRNACRYIVVYITLFWILPARRLPGAARIGGAGGRRLRPRRPRPGILGVAVERMGGEKRRSKTKTDARDDVVEASGARKGRRMPPGARAKSPRRLARRFAFPLIAAVLTTSLVGAARAGERLRLATTTSTENSGLLRVLLPPFERKFGCAVDVIAVGTGRALRLGEAGDVDAVLVHAPDLEEKFLSDGFGVAPREIMHNDFVILGPPEDPAQVRAASDAADAFRAIARARAPFVSRGDESGTHRKEKETWRAAGVVPQGPWYIETGLGMGDAVRVAAEKRGYVLCDRGTYLAHKAKNGLAVLFEGDGSLRNAYSIIAVNPARHPHVKYGLAVKLADFLAGPEGQALIAGFRAGGETLFHPSGRTRR